MFEKNFGLPPAAVAAAEDYLGDTHYTPYNSLAFVVNKLNGTQLSYHLINKINEQVKENPFLAISIFTLEQESVITKVNTAVYNIFEVKDYYGPLIYCDYPSFDFGSKFVKNEGYFLMYDPLLMCNIWQGLNQERRDYLKNYQDRIFVRGTDYDKLVKKNMGFDVKTVNSNFKISEFFGNIKGLYGKNKEAEAGSFVVHTS